MSPARHRRPIAVLSLTLALLAPVAMAQDAINPQGLDDIIKGRPYSPYADRAFPTNV